MSSKAEPERALSAVYRTLAIHGISPARIRPKEKSPRGMESPLIGGILLVVTWLLIAALVLAGLAATALLLVRLVAPRPLLITIAYSHYCEAARWALSIANLPFAELKVPVGPHTALVPLLRLAFGAMLHDSDPATSYPGSDVAHPWWSIAGKRLLRRLAGVPLLVTPEGACVTTSWEIIEWCGLEVDAATRTAFDHELAPAVRRQIYHAIFESAPHLYRELMSADPVLMTLFDASEALFRPSASIRTFLGVDAAAMPATRDTIRKQLAQVSEVLVSDPYLGDGSGSLDFGGADLALASLLAPLLLPPNYGGGALTRVPAPSELAHDEGYSALHAEVKATRAGQHVLRCYREHRQAVGQAARDKAE